MNAPQDPATNGSASEPLFRPGETCWRVAHAQRVALLRNADAYYHEIAKALRHARRSVYILAWDFDQRIQLTRGRPDDQVSPCSLGELLIERVEAEPELEVRILIWDKAPLYAKSVQGVEALLNPEQIPAVNIDHPRIHIGLDGCHPAVSSPHQKVAVIDDAIAFAGGIDLTQARWDTAEHAPEDKRRKEPDEASYRPYHDIQILVDGDAAAALGDLARERWRRAERFEAERSSGSGTDNGNGTDVGNGTDDGAGRTASDLPGPFEGDDHDPWPDNLAPDLTDVEVAIARTDPAYGEQEQVSEIEALFLAMIARARDTIFIEQQYFTDPTVCAALCDRLREPDGPELIMIMPRDTTGLLARLTMETMLPVRLHRLRRADRHNRLRVLYPDAPGIPEEKGTSINVHAKLMIVDDRLLRIGSANLNHKSMADDCECDLAIDAEDNAEHRAAIRRFRHAVLGEHLALPPEEVDAAEEEGDSLIATVDRLRAKDGPTLVDIEARLPGWLSTLLDAMPQPTAGRADHAVGARPRPGEWLGAPGTPRIAGDGGHGRATRHAPTWLIAAAVVGLLALGAAWRWTPLGELLDAESLARTLRSTPWTGPALFALYVVGTQFMLPVHVLHVVAVLVLGPRAGMLWAIAGTMVSALVSYGLGSWIGRDTLRERFGERVLRISERAGKAGLRGALLLRLVPGAPFGLSNMVFGASHVALRDFILATTLVMLPSPIVIAVAGEGAARAWLDPSPRTIALLAAGAVVVGVALWLGRQRLEAWSQDTGAARRKSR